MTSYLPSVNENAIEASYDISYCISCCSNSHTIVEVLIQEAVQRMLGEHVWKMNTILLSNNTKSRRIQDVSDDVETAVIGRIFKNKFFAIHVDESIDAANFCCFAC